MDNIVSAAAYIFAINQQKQWCILCGKRSGHDYRHRGGLYDVPVGMRENGEEPIDTAIRETYEEAGISIPKGKLKFVGSQAWGNGNAGANFLCILDNCPQIGRGDWEHEGFMWLPITDISKLPWAFGMGEMAKRLFSSFVNNQRKSVTISESMFKKVIGKLLKENR